jgi:c-di-GMP-binding flagellar brake protein YcgR
MTDKPALPTNEIVRRYLRISCNISVRVFHGAKYTDGRGHDIGTGGMAIYVPLDIDVGSSINLSFQLPCSRMVLGVRALVRNRDGFRYGVEFADLTPTEAEEIQRIANMMAVTANPESRTELKVSSALL